MKMKLFKGYVCLLLVIITSFMFAGCGQVNNISTQQQNTINYSTMEISKEEIKDSITASLFMESENIQTEFKKNQVVNSVTITLNEKYLRFINEMETNRNLYQFQGDEEMATIYSELLTSVHISEPYWENNDFNCLITFKSTTARALFYNSTEDIFTQGKTANNLFTQKLYFNGDLTATLNNGLFALVYPSLKSSFVEFNQNNFELTYSYLAPAKRYHSNANYLLNTDEGYLHTWIVDQNNENQEIYFYLVLARRSSFYMLAILISLVLTTILLIVALLLKINKNKKNKLK
ncbi:MAG: hypothetical protein IJX26_01345 [Clostridia bacterium]|nr:hypothetical protein [Clostridia bacterium]